MQPFGGPNHAAMNGAPWPDGGPLVVVVILNWQDGHATLACVASLKVLANVRYRVIVVDNGSTDGSADRLAAVEGVDLIRNRQNLGFAGGVNVGLRQAMQNGADYVWILNNDATVTPDALARLVAAAESDPRIGLVSPVFHDPLHPETLEFCVGRFNPHSRYADQTNIPATAHEWQRTYPDQVVLLGTALLIRRSLIEAIGGLDDRFFAYVEDVDYCLRATAAGFRNVALPSAIVYHRFKTPVENPSGCPDYLHYFMTRNYLLLWKKLPGPVLLRKAALWFLHQRLIQIERAAGARGTIDAILAGLWDGLRGVGGPYDPAHRMPWPLRSLLGRCPRFWIRLMDGKPPLRSTRG
jgi:GT2 family glycosyltransferase